MRAPIRPFVALVPWLSIGLTVGLTVGLAGGCEATQTPPDWRQTLAERVAVFGHRNVIAVVDSAYPAHSQLGIETIATGRSEIDVVAAVLGAVRAAGHVRARVFVDRELDLVAESEAPGIEAYRGELKRILESLPVESLPHEDLIARLDKAAAMFRVLVLKSDTAIPYTSVFVQLESGYWSDAAEKRLREAAAERKP